MSDCGLLLELGSSHCQGRCELFIIGNTGQAGLRLSVMTPLLHDGLSWEHLKCPVDSATNSPRLSCSCMSRFKTLRPLSGSPHDDDIKHK